MIRSDLCLYRCVQNFMKKISIFGVDLIFNQYFYVSIDFVLNTQIENIGQNQHFFRDILHTAV